MKIYGLDDKEFLDVPITSSAEHEQELSKSDYVKLSWNDMEKAILPVGAYIIPFSDGLKYRLLEPYYPNQNNEKEWKYEPQFQHPLMWLSKIPFTYTTVDKDSNLTYVSQDWPYLGLTSSLLQVVVDQINDLFGFTTEDDKFSYEIVGDVDTTVNVTFSSTDILSALTAIASACTDNTCEWHISWENKCLYFGQIFFDQGEATPTLKVGENIGKASVTSSKDGYYNVFFPQGSTRNISAKLSNGHYLASSLRLGLNYPKYSDSKFSDGLVDIRSAATRTLLGLDLEVNANEPKQELALTFDDVYPHVNCYVYNVRSRTAKLIDESTKEVALDSQGNEIVYSIWYFRLAYPVTIQDSDCLKNADGTYYTTAYNGQTYYWKDYYVDEKKDVIDGYTLHGQFTANGNSEAFAQPLLGQPSSSEGFEMVCHQSDTDIKLDSGATLTNAEGSKVIRGDGLTVKEGDFEVVYSKNGDIIIPTTTDDGLYPRGDEMPSFKANEVILYNIALTENEVKAAQDELLQRAKKEIVRRNQDLNNYSFASYPHVFEEDLAKENPSDRTLQLYIGKRVIFDDNAGNTLSTRIIKLTTKIDCPFEQQITVGNQKIKGTQSQLKEDVRMIMSGNWSGGGGLNDTQVRNIIRNYGGSLFLSKLYDDTAAGLITFLKGIALGDGSYGITDAGIATLAKLVADEIMSKAFRGDDIVGGSGFHIWTDSDGRSHVITDYFSARVKAFFAELEIRKVSATGGNILFSNAGSRIAYVKEYEEDGISGWKCYFETDDGTTATTNTWEIGDQALCQTFNIKAGTSYNASNRYYWRLVVGKGEEKITDADGNAIDKDKSYGYVFLADHYTDADGNETTLVSTLTDADGNTIEPYGDDGYFRLKQTDSLPDGWTANDNPLANDSIAQVGCQTKEGVATRGNAMQIVTNASEGEAVPSLNMYKSVNDYVLPKFRVIQISPDGIVATVKKSQITIVDDAGEAVSLFTWRGSWTDGMTVNNGDVVTYGGQSWAWDGDDGSTPSAPGGSSADAWTLAAKAGSSGTPVTKTGEKVEYAISASGTVAPTSTDDWGEAVKAATEEEPYLWTKVTVTFSSGDPVVSYSVSRQGTDGDKGKALVVSSETKYCVSGTKPSSESGYTLTEFPDVSKGDTVWSVTITTYTDPDSGSVVDTTKSYGCSRIGGDGDKGAGMHIAYSTAYPVTEDSFTKVYADGVEYIGTYSSTDTDDGEWDDSRWVWQRIKGEKGDDIITLVLDNEMDSVPCDADGYVLEETVITVNPRLYIGAEAQKGAMLSTTGLNIDGASLVTASVGEQWIQWTFPKGTQLSESRYIKTIAMTYGGETRSAIFTLNVVKAGAEGISPAVYDVKPSPTALSFATGSDGKTLTPDSISLACGYSRSQGGTVSVFDAYAGTQIDSLYYIYYRTVGSDTWTLYTEALTVESGTSATAYEFCISSAESAGDVADDNIIDLQTVPVIKGGTDGDNGDTPYIGDNGNWWTGTTDTGVKAQGNAGASAVTYEAVPAKETAEVTVSTVTSGDNISVDSSTLAIDVEYTVQKKVGGTVTDTAASFDWRLDYNTTGGTNITSGRGVAKGSYSKNGIDYIDTNQSVVATFYLPGTTTVIATRTIPIVLKPQSLITSVGDTNTAIAANKDSISVVQQTADSISAKVDSVVHPNLLVGSGLDTEDGVYQIRENDATDSSGAVTADNTAEVSTTEQYGGTNSLHVKTAAAERYAGIYFRPVAVRRNTKYHVSVWAKGSGTFSIECISLSSATNDGTGRVSPWIDSKTYTLSDDWTLYGTDITTGDYDYIEANFWCGDADTECWLSRFKLEEGYYTVWTAAADGANRLLATGIDIAQRKIVATADRFEWVDNSGNAMASFDSSEGATFDGNLSAKTISTNSGNFSVDEDGKLSASGVDVSGDVSTTDSSTGQSTRLSGGGIQVYNKSGSLVTEHTGEKFDTVDDILPGTAYSPTAVTDSHTVSTDTSLRIGSSENIATYSAMSGTAAASGMFTVTGTVTVEGIWASDSNRGGGPTVAGNIYLNGALVHSVSATGSYASPGKIVESGVSFSGTVFLAKGSSLDIKVRAYISSNSGSMGTTMYTQVTFAVSSVAFKTSGYYSKFFGNGIMLSQDSGDYLAAMMQTVNSATHLLFQAVSNGAYGLRVGSDGVQALIGSQWCQQPRTVAYLRIAGGTSPSVSRCPSGYSFNTSGSAGAKYGVITRSATGRYTVTFPTDWQSLGLGSNGYAMTTVASVTDAYFASCEMTDTQLKIYIASNSKAVDTTVDVEIRIK